MLRINTHPAGWKLRRAGAKEGSKRSNSMLLPMGPGEQDLVISSWALMALFAFCALDKNTDDAYQLYNALGKLEARKNFRISNIKGITTDSEAALVMWKVHYAECIEAFVNPKKDQPAKGEDLDGDQAEKQEDSKRPADLNLELLDRFALAALPGVIKTASDSGLKNLSMSPSEWVAISSYNIAKAMLKERNKWQKTQS